MEDSNKDTAGVQKAVIYTDGGCQSPAGAGGWGYHGYSYLETPPKQGSGAIQLPTARGYERDRSKKELAVTVVEYYDGFGPVLPQGTNNKAELLGATRAIQLAVTLPITELLLKVDSRYVLDGITKWVGAWEEAGWVKPNGEEVKNKHYWMELVSALQQLEDKGVAVSWEWVKGHNGHLGNERADHNATCGIALFKKGARKDHLRTSPAQGYWKPKNEINRMFALSKWYFNTNIPVAMTDDGLWIYHLGEHGKEEEEKPVSDTTYSVVFLKDHDPVLEVVRSYHNSLNPKGLSAVIRARLDNIMSPSIYSELAESGDVMLIQPDPRRMDLHHLKGEQLTREKNPPRLALRAVEDLSLLEGLLTDYRRDPAARGITVTDVTERFYEFDKKGVCKLKKEFTNALKSIELEANYDLGKAKGVAPVTITFGIDIAKRNTLSALAVRSPKVRLITWAESAQAFRYATVIEAGDDIGIWAGIFSNVRVLTSTN